MGGGGHFSTGVDCPPLPPLPPLTMFIGTRYEKLFPASFWRAFRNFKWPGSSQSLWSLYKNESIQEGWGGVGTLPRGRLSPSPIDYVHRDEIGEIVSSILLNGIQKLQITRINPFDHYIKMKAYMRVEGGDTLPRGRLSPPLLCS